MPVYNEQRILERHNVYHVSMLIRHAKNGNYYLYDILDIKKKRATRSDFKIILGTNPFLAFILMRTDGFVKMKLNRSGKTIPHLTNFQGICSHWKKLIIDKIFALCGNDMWGNQRDILTFLFICLYVILNMRHKLIDIIKNAIT